MPSQNPPRPRRCGGEGAWAARTRATGSTGPLCLGEFSHPTRFVSVPSGRLSRWRAVGAVRPSTVTSAGAPRDGLRAFRAALPNPTGLTLETGSLRSPAPLLGGGVIFFSTHTKPPMAGPFPFNGNVRGFDSHRGFLERMHRTPTGGRQATANGVDRAGLCRSRSQSSVSD